ncbi:hypothetical protein ANACOL_01716, partial [Anaerotruncus colihominis DSM 17241]
ERRRRPTRELAFLYSAFRIFLCRLALTVVFRGKINYNIKYCL